jgi:hypothetical protein
LDLSSGTLMGKVDSGRAAGTAQNWEFSTPAAVIGIRGTEFAIQADRQAGTRLAVFEGRVEMQPAETAEGLQPMMEIQGGHESVSRRGKPIQTLPQFSPGMKALDARRALFRRRMKQAQDTWSPFTTGVRAELRRKFVAPPPKTRPARPHPPRKRPGAHQSTS